MTDLRMSFRSVRGLALAGLLLSLTGCADEPTTPPPSATTPSAGAGSGANAKKPEAKVVGGKKDLMEGIPKKPR